MPLKRFYNFCLGPIDSIRLDIFRFLTGLVMLLYFSAWWRYDAGEWLTSEGFHVSSKALWGSLVFPAMPSEFLTFFGIVFFSGIILWTLGFKTSCSVWVVLAGTLYVSYADPLSVYTINKFFIITLSVFAFVAETPQGQFAWPLRILQGTLLLHYFVSGYSKIFWGDWLTNPNVLWSQLQGSYMTDSAAWMLRTFPKEFLSVMQYGALAFEILAPILFLCKRFRAIGLLWGFTFQILVALTMHQLIYFSLQMICLYVLFFQESTLHRIYDQLKALTENILKRRCCRI